ncbi:MAG: helix-turn-helix domain-containing protein [Gallionella sp.]|uniref:Helix-turn-helix domain-containing protein n=1 Tax=mine drainage metagenome TaxID=410659 RepID=E6QXE8_9ZZZZ|nr:helix-turn-helix domain-containing protein [Gallionella sp.]
MTTPTYTLEEAAQYLNISPSHLSDLILSGNLPAAKICRCWVIRGVDLEAYLAEQVRTQTQRRREGLGGEPVLSAWAEAVGVRRKRKGNPELPALNS